MNTIQEISNELLRERGGSAFEPASRVAPRIDPAPRPVMETERQRQRHAESRELMHRLTGFAR